VALKAVFFDVGETLVDEERWWRELARRSGLQPHVVWAALGVTIERGEEHEALWGHLGIDRPDEWWHGLTYSLDDLYPDAIDCLERVRSLDLLVGVVGNQTEALERWAREAVLPADVISSSASLGVRKPDLRFFELVAELAGCAPTEARMSAIASTTTFSPLPQWGSLRFTSGVGRGGDCSRHPPRPPSVSTTSLRSRKR